MRDCNWGRCVKDNLKTHAQGDRMRHGIVALGISLILLIVLVKGDLPTWSRLTLFLPFFMACGGALAGLYRNCPAASLKGVTIEDHDGEVPIVDARERYRARTQGIRLMGSAFCLAVSMTGATLLI